MSSQKQIVSQPRKDTQKRYGMRVSNQRQPLEGSFYPRLPNGKRKKFNVYAAPPEQCGAKLAEMIAEKKAEIAEEKAKRKEGAE